MARFDVYENANTASPAPYLLDVQADRFLESVKTRVVVPLVPVETFGTRIERLHLTFEIGPGTYVAVFPELAGTPQTNIGPKVKSLAEHHFAIVDALDFLLQGF